MFCCNQISASRTGSGTFHWHRYKFGEKNIKLPMSWEDVTYSGLTLISCPFDFVFQIAHEKGKRHHFRIFRLPQFAVLHHVYPASPYFRTCWVYNLCRSMRIYKNQITDIDPKYGSIKIFADLCGSISINFA